MKSKLEIYALAVCFASVVVIVISAGIAGYSVLEITIPEITMSAYKYDRFESNDAYWKNRSSCSDDSQTDIRPSEDVLTRQRMDAYSSAVSTEQRRGLQSLIRCFMFLLVSGVTLFIHWKIAARARG